jgi:hypothetical protein
MADGAVHLGITGLDVVMEHGGSEVVVVHDGLGYGHCELVLAVPEAWIDVERMTDLVDIALDFREHKALLRIATKFTSDPPSCTNTVSTISRWSSRRAPWKSRLPWVTPMPYAT